jgi:uncharacterized membrane protein YccF (DUF307 family)
MSDQNVIVNVNLGAPVMQVHRQPGCLIQLLYFCFIGCWLGGLAVGLAYLLFALVITIPLGVKIINRIPYLMALRQPPLAVTPWGEVKVQQHNILLRAVWFVFVGFSLTAIWMSLAYLLCITIIGMPAGFWMFDRAPALLTLRKS